MSSQDPKELFKLVFNHKPRRLGFEVVGSIAVVEVEKTLDQALLKDFAMMLLKNFKALKTVLLKQAGRSGEFRVQSLKYLAGVRTTRTLHKENNYCLEVDLARAYFSPRLANERLRIARSVNPKEKVLVMFSGVSPYVIAIAKHAKPALVVGVEKNFYAHELAIKNVAINRLLNIELYYGDVKVYATRERRVFDRIVMPLPKGSELFLKEAAMLCNKTTVIHLYLFSTKEGLKERINNIKKQLKKMGLDVISVNAVRAGQFSARNYRWCLDLRLMKN